MRLRSMQSLFSQASLVLLQYLHSSLRMSRHALHVNAEGAQSEMKYAAVGATQRGLAVVRVCPILPHSTHCCRDPVTQRGVAESVIMCTGALASNRLEQNWSRTSWVGRRLPNSDVFLKEMFGQAPAANL
jgi:hypothetical protein